MSEAAGKLNQENEAWKKQAQQELQRRALSAWKVFVPREVSSTMDDAKEIHALSSDNPFLVLAEHQHRGRGRRGNAWLSPEGAFAATFVLPMKGEQGANALAGYSLVAGISVLEALEELCGHFSKELLRLKWPNDIFSSTGEKIGGILVEVLSQPARQAYSVGIGLNVASAPLSITQSMSLASLFPHVPTNPQLAASLAARLAANTERFERDGFRPFLHVFESVAILLGEEVRIDVDGQVSEGIFIGVDEQGCLKLSMQRSKEEQHFASGHLRPLLGNSFLY